MVKENESESRVLNILFKCTNEIIAFHSSFFINFAEYCGKFQSDPTFKNYEKIHHIIENYSDENVSNDLNFNDVIFFYLFLLLGSIHKIPY
jgi:hypothetical protein